MIVLHFLPIGLAKSYMFLFEVFVLWVLVRHYERMAFCIYVTFSLTELKELSSSLTTQEMMSEVRELKAECSGYAARLEKIKSATNHVTPEEKEKVGAETKSRYYRSSFRFAVPVS